MRCFMRELLFLIGSGRLGAEATDARPTLGNPARPSDEPPTAHEGFSGLWTRTMPTQQDKTPFALNKLRQYRRLNH